MTCNLTLGEYGVNKGYLEENSVSIYLPFRMNNSRELKMLLGRSNVCRARF